MKSFATSLSVFDIWGCLSISICEISDSYFYPPATLRQYSLVLLETIDWQNYDVEVKVDFSYCQLAFLIGGFSETMQQFIFQSLREFS